MSSKSLYMVGGAYMIVLFLSVLVSVGFVTLLERKVLGIVQLRVGPNKVGILGIFQPIGDGLKLMAKGGMGLFSGRKWIYWFMPLSMFIIMLWEWVFVPLGSGLNNFSNGVLLSVIGLSLMVYPVMVGGWFSGSLYSMMGSIRSVAQIISYEVSFIIILVGFLAMASTFSLTGFVLFNFIILFFYPMLVLMFMSALMETNRTPSDLIEGESELVSGFNVEYYGIGFALIFMGEYGLIIFSSSLLISFSLGISPFSLVGVVLMGLVVFFFCLLRGVLPRIRYDYLMVLCWISVVNVSIGYLIFLIGIIFNLLLW